MAEMGEKDSEEQECALTPYQWAHPEIGARAELMANSEEKFSLPKLSKYALVMGFAKMIDGMLLAIGKGSVPSAKVLTDLAAILDSDEPITQATMDSFAQRLIAAAEQEREKQTQE